MQSHVDLYVEPGNVTSIIGSSGGSKTTLLRCSLFEVPLAMYSARLLFDEPTSALDPGSHTEVSKVIRELAQAELTMVPHDLLSAGRISDDIVFMDMGGIVESRPPDQTL